jgi:fructokinase
MIVVVGESLVDIIVNAGAPRESVGGSPLNVATTLARLEVPTLLITESGHDDRGARIVEQVEASGAELIASPTRSGRTATATVRLEDGEPSYEFDIGWHLPHQELPPCDALHVGSLGTVIEPGRNSVFNLVDQAWARDVFLSYDPNVREALLADRIQAWRDIEALADRANLVKLSTQDVALLQPGADADDIARSLLDGDRTEMVLLTRGADGASAYVDGLTVSVPAYEVEVVDTMGAGDAFMAAALAVLLEGSSFGSYGAGVPTDRARVEQLLWAAVELAGLTCSRPGAAAPSLQELRRDWPA